MIVSASGKEVSAPPIQVLNLILAAKDALADMGISMQLICQECTRRQPGQGGVQGGEFGQGNNPNDPKFVISCHHKEWVWNRGSVL